MDEIGYITFTCVFQLNREQAHGEETDKHNGNHKNTICIRYNYICM